MNYRALWFFVGAYIFSILLIGAWLEAHGIDVVEWINAASRGQ